LPLWLLPRLLSSADGNAPTCRPPRDRQGPPGTARDRQGPPGTAKDRQGPPTRPAGATPIRPRLRHCTARVLRHRQPSTTVAPSSAPRATVTSPSRTPTASGPTSMTSRPSQVLGLPGGLTLTPFARVTLPSWRRDSYTLALRAHCSSAAATPRADGHHPLRAAAAAALAPAATASTCAIAPPQRPWAPSPRQPSRLDPGRRLRSHSRALAKHPLRRGLHRSWSLHPPLRGLLSPAWTSARMRCPSLDTASSPIRGPWSRGFSTSSSPGSLLTRHVWGVGKHSSSCPAFSYLELQARPAATRSRWSKRPQYEIEPRLSSLASGTCSSPTLPR
jgi:hypothetical protein